ncbi:hypothetical protein, partial [Enterobacter hormaechei]|uniref:hypothetical protein n=1 Tax=Enterobacter hormaechei TaxID=158836 RepID=UPI001953E33B
MVPAIKQYAFLIDKARVQARVTLLGADSIVIDVPTGGAALEPSAAVQASVALPPGPTREVPLIELAYARSGDKGDTSN